MIIGITGKIGSGKTTVSRYFKGYKHIDVDKVGWTVLESKEIEIKEIFGEKIIKNKKIDRRKLSDIVFKDNKKLKKLNKLTHDEIHKKVKQKITKKTIIDAALLKEIGLDKLCNLVILVKTSKRLVKKRTKIKNIEKILEKQKNYEKPNIILYNNGSRQKLSSIVKEIRQRLKV